jgi:hypothetical protein
MANPTLDDLSSMTLDGLGRQIVVPGSGRPLGVGASMARLARNVSVLVPQAVPVQIISILSGISGSGRLLGKPLVCGDDECRRVWAIRIGCSTNQLPIEVVDGVSGVAGLA